MIEPTSDRVESPPVLTKLDRAFLFGGSDYDRRQLPPGRDEELRSVCEWWGDEKISSFLRLIVVKTPDGLLWGYRQHIYPGEETWHDDAPLFRVEETTVTHTTFTKPGGEDLEL